VTPRPRVAQTFTDCTRVVHAVINRNSREECDKAHRRFLKRLRDSVETMGKRKDKRS
jgi:hypothetical protein